MLEPLEVEYTDEEQAIHAALKRYAELRQASAQDNAEQFATDFVLKTLKKRLFSSPAAFLTHAGAAREVAAQRQASGRPSRSRRSGVLQRQIDRMDEDYADDDEYDEATDDALDAASRLFREPTDEELALLKEMKDVGGTGLRPSSTPRPRQLIALAERAHPARRQVDRRAGHHLHRVPGHAELAARKSSPPRGSRAATGS